MNIGEDGGYDDGYAACPCFWGSEPANLVKEVLSFFTDTTNIYALDAGCGEGKNSYYLAKHGIHVHALDISSYAISNAKNSWPNLPNITWEVNDVRKARILHNSFDIVVSTGMLHCLSSEEEILQAIQRIQSLTKVGGYNVISSFNKRLQDLSGHSPLFNPCLLDHDFYTESYQNWKIIYESDLDLDDVHPNNNIQHRHSISRILAQKL